MTFRIPYLDKKDWQAIRKGKRTGGLIEIDCVICGEQVYNEEGGFKISPESLEKGYPCFRCGTIYKAKFQDNHFHLNVKIPDEVKKAAKRG